MLARVPNAGDGSLNLTNLFFFFYSVSCSRYVLASKCQVAFGLISLRARVLQQNTVVGRWREPEENNYPAVRRSRSGVVCWRQLGLPRCGKREDGQGRGSQHARLDSSVHHGVSSISGLLMLRAGNSSRRTYAPTCRIGELSFPEQEGRRMGRRRGGGGKGGGAFGKQA